MTPHDIAAISAYFMEGFTAHYHEEDPHSTEYYQLILELTQYAHYTWDLYVSGKSAVNQVSGVYEAYVAGKFGEWFAEFLIDFETTPTSDEAHNKLLALAETFFLKQLDADPDAVAAALEGVSR